MPSRAIQFPPDDPLAQLMKPPPDETQDEMQVRLKREEDARRISEAIDDSLRQERLSQRKRKLVKLLLLGQSESGKSTTLRQFQRLYTPSAFHDERVLWRAVIQLNLVRSIRTILETLTAHQEEIQQRQQHIQQQQQQQQSYYYHQGRHRQHRNPYNENEDEESDEVESADNNHQTAYPSPSHSHSNSHSNSHSHSRSNPTNTNTNHNTLYTYSSDPNPNSNPYSHSHSQDPDSSNTPGADTDPHRDFFDEIDQFKMRLLPLRHIEALLIAKLVPPNEDEATDYGFSPSSSYRYHPPGGGGGAGTGMGMGGQSQSQSTVVQVSGGNGKGKEVDYGYGYEYGYGYDSSPYADSTPYSNGRSINGNGNGYNNNNNHNNGGGGMSDFHYLGPSGRRAPQREIFVRAGVSWKGALAKGKTHNYNNHGHSRPHTPSIEKNGGGGGGVVVGGIGDIDRGDPIGERETDEPTAVLHALRNDVVDLWLDDEVREVLKIRKVRLEESPGFFLNDLERIASMNYLPSEDDVLRARLKTVGVSEYNFRMESAAGRDAGTEWRIVDVGGARSQRQTWIPFFDDVDAIIFLAPISCFDQVLAEDRSVNRLEDSVLLWKMICSNELLQNVELVLFLNKCDILDRKLRSGIRLAKYVRSFQDRPNDSETVQKYFRAKFNAIHREYSPKSRKFYGFCTSVTEITTTAGILASVRDMVIREHLRKSKLI